MVTNGLPHEPGDAAGRDAPGPAADAPADARGADGRPAEPQANALRASAIGWAGKLPSRGDFVTRGLPRAWQRVWDGWLQAALADAAQRLGAGALRDGLAAMPPWRCLVLPGAAGEPAWTGALAASHDRVGRVFPLLLVEAYDAAALDDATLAALRERGHRVATWLLDTIETVTPPKEFERGALALAGTAWLGDVAHDPPAAADPDGTAPRVADLRAAAPHAASFWWRADSVDRPGTPPLAEAWPPRAALVLEWLGQAGRADAAGAMGGAAAEAPAADDPPGVDPTGGER